MPIFGSKIPRALLPHSTLMRMCPKNNGGVFQSFLGSSLKTGRGPILLLPFPCPVLSTSDSRVLLPYVCLFLSFLGPSFLPSDVTGQLFPSITSEFPLRNLIHIPFFSLNLRRGCDAVSTSEFLPRPEHSVSRDQRPSIYVYVYSEGTESINQ